MLWGDIMNTQEIIKACEEIGVAINVVTIDQLPLHQFGRIENYEYLIINTEDSRSSQLGHWILVIKCKREKILYLFDSYAMSPMIYDNNLMNFMKKHVSLNKKRWNIRLQSYNTLVCGCYVIFLMYLIKKNDDLGLGLNEMKTLFRSNNYFANDVKLVKIVYEIFKTLPDCKKMLCDETVLDNKYCNRLC